MTGEIMGYRRTQDANAGVGSGQFWNRLPENEGAVSAIRRHIWKSLNQSQEPFWLQDTSHATAQRLLELTIRRRREIRALEGSWIQFLSLPTPAC